MYPLKDNQHVVFSVVEKDAKGLTTNTPFDAPPTWSASDATVLVVTPAADGLSADVSPGSSGGTAQLLFAGLIGGKAFAGSVDVQIIPGDAVSIELVPGAPSDI